MTVPKKRTNVLKKRTFAQPSQEQDFVLDFNDPQGFLNWWNRLFPVDLAAEDRARRSFGCGL